MTTGIMVGVVSRCYAVADVSGNASIGGIVGAGEGAYAEVNNCFFLNGTSVYGTRTSAKVDNVSRKIGDLTSTALVSALGARFTTDDQNINSGWPILIWQNNS